MKHDASKNVKVDAAVLADLVRLRAAMERLGIVRSKGEYRLSPALGGGQVQRTAPRHGLLSQDYQ